jgi:hypothetical protein
MTRDQRNVEGEVLGVRPVQLKVLRSIVAPDVIAVMNLLTWG